MTYYAGREVELRDLFGATEVQVEADAVVVDGRRLAVIDDVIIAISADRLPSAIRARSSQQASAGAAPYAPDIQHTFGEEWKAHGGILPEHKGEFEQYFDLVDIDALAGKRVADLGCGSGRWAWFLRERCDLVVVDFSDAIFVARENLRDAPRTIFVLADVLDLPFRDGAFDFAYCLGVLHHLPFDALAATRRLARVAPRLLVYLYYALDNRPWHYRALLRAVTAVRLGLARVSSNRARAAISWLIAVTVYLPLSVVGRALRPTGLDKHVPLSETYAGKSVARLQQDAYDRFFTRIEQRVSRQQIRELTDTFARVEISPGLPYWHFLCTA